MLMVFVAGIGLVSCVDVSTLTQGMNCTKVGAQTACSGENQEYSSTRLSIPDIQKSDSSLRSAIEPILLNHEGKDSFNKAQELRIIAGICPFGKSRYGTLEFNFAVIYPAGSCTWKLFTIQPTFLVTPDGGVRYVYQDPDNNFIQTVYIAMCRERCSSNLGSCGVSRTRTYTLLAWDPSVGFWSMDWYEFELPICCSCL